MRSLTVSEVARSIQARPRDISALFYDRTLSDAVCPVVNHRRRIPEEYIPRIEAALRERGFLTEAATAGN